jgi:hypothetical protein
MARRKPALPPFVTPDGYLNFVPDCTTQAQGVPSWPPGSGSGTLHAIVPSCGAVAPDPSLDDLDVAILQLLLVWHPKRLSQDKIAGGRQVLSDKKTVRKRLQRFRKLGLTHTPGRGEGLTPEGLRHARSLPSPAE